MDLDATGWDARPLYARSGRPRGALFPRVVCHRSHSGSNDDQDDSTDAPDRARTRRSGGRRGTGTVRVLRPRTLPVGRSAAERPARVRGRCAPHPVRPAAGRARRAGCRRRRSRAHRGDRRHRRGARDEGAPHIGAREPVPPRRDPRRPGQARRPAHHQPGTGSHHRSTHACRRDALLLYPRERACRLRGRNVGGLSAARVGGAGYAGDAAEHAGRAQPVGQPGRARAVRRLVQLHLGGDGRALRLRVERALEHMGPLQPLPVRHEPRLHRAVTGSNPCHARRDNEMAPAGVRGPPQHDGAVLLPSASRPHQHERSPAYGALVRDLRAGERGGLRSLRLAILRARHL